MIEGLFTTVTNVNFDDARLERVKENIQQGSSDQYL